MHIILSLVAPPAGAARTHSHAQPRTAAHSRAVCGRRARGLGQLWLRSVLSWVARQACCRFCALRALPPP